MTSMTCWNRARARLSQRRIRAGCARPYGGNPHIGEIRLRDHMHILKTDSIHVSAAAGPALKRHCGPRTAAISVRDCRA
ncbi:MAG TPA: hypothetical protein VJ654_00750 [Noviherbaspirillum sp.]|nr:hypothetical protein [Noviherbaspirillum sp.]